MKHFPSTSNTSRLFVMEELSKDRNDLQIGKDTHIQFLYIRLSATDRQFFDRQKCFLYSKRMFLLCLIRCVKKLYTYQNTSGTNYNDQWAIYWTCLTTPKSIRFHQHSAATLSSVHLLCILSMDILKKESATIYHHSPCCKF